MVRINATHYQRSIVGCLSAQEVLFILVDQLLDMRLHESLKAFLLIFVLLTLYQILDESFFNSDMRNSQHHMFTMEIYSEESTF